MRDQPAKCVKAAAPEETGDAVEDEGMQARIA